MNGDDLTIKERIIKLFAENLGAKIVSRGVAALAALLVEHGLMNVSAKDQWVATTTQLGTGLLLAGITLWLTKKTDTHVKQATTDAVQTALVTTPASDVSLADQAKAIIQAPTPNGLPRTP